MTAPPRRAAKRRESPRILHIAGHGVVDPTRPELSHLALTPGDGEDGVLEVHEAYGLELQGTELVVLSACSTAEGSLGGGDEVVGLSRAFLVSGARSVVSSLWQVDDEATEILMVAMYEALVAGASPAEALRIGQAKVRANPDTAAPYYWAAFQVTGQG